MKKDIDEINELVKEEIDEAWKNAKRVSSDMTEDAFANCESTAKLCKNCKYSETYKERDHSFYRNNTPEYIGKRRCTKLLNFVRPRLDNEEGYTGVVSIDVDDDFRCIKFEPKK